ncbi:hypothetical protein M413DRAFT_13037 [Hebeloma cylindrosporum]|uniref:Mob1/phocein n=1 Tax=Hebeloma cylindrosporum TaxID=76867 RepID=A0A0C3BN26_HEBCY|nr:hypothetical protein M413DRAFT_13037 [Hebeloma cylindrosporum h7]
MAAVIQRPLRGSRISTFYPVKNLPSLSSLDSAFQLQEYISLLIRLDVHDVDAIVSLPGSPSKGENRDEQGDGVKEGEKESEKGKNEITVDEACWIYEQLRRLAQDLSHPLITTLQQECTRASCPEMKAGEWLYLCVAHGNDGAMEQCCAIDYILHTVDSATALLNSPPTFPSRLQIPQTSHRHFSSLARRLGRIFAHAYFHHRDAFEQAEAESSLYARFLALTAKFDLVPAEFLVIPSSQFSGDDSRDREDYEHSRQQYTPQIKQDHHSLPSTITQEEQDHLIEEDIPNRGSTSINGGIGESPTASSRSRFGRNRTGTMVFAEVEAAAIADELAARARVGDFEPDFEAGGPKTARPSAQEQEDLEADAGAHFEISLDPEEEISDVFTEDITAVPTESSLPEKVQEAPSPPPVEEAAPEGEKLDVDDLDLESEPVETLPAESPVVEQPTTEPTAVVPPAEPEPEVQKPVKEEEAVQEPLPVPEPVAEVSEAIQPSTAAEAVPLLPEPRPTLDEPTTSTIEATPSSIDESTPAPAPVAADASILLEVLEPIIGEIAPITAEKTEVAAPTLMETDIAPVASIIETPSVNEEPPKDADVKEEPSNAPPASAS